MKKITINGKEFTLAATLLTLSLYKKLTGRCFQADLRKQNKTEQQLLLINQQYGEYSLEKYEAMSIDEKIEYVTALNSIDVEDDFKSSFVVACIMAGGDRRTESEIRADIPLSELAPHTELSNTIFDFINAMNYDPNAVKKN